MVSSQIWMRDCYAKLFRSIVHYKSIRELVDGIENRLEFVVEPDGGERSYTCRLVGQRAPSPQVGLAVGDCVHNARSALDHLVAGLTELHTGRPAGEQSTSAFPLIKESTKWEASRRYIRTLPAPVQERIWELQPFNYDNAAVWGDLAPALLPLSLEQLTLLDNIDKHRALHVGWHLIPMLEVRLPALLGRHPFDEFTWASKVGHDGWLASFTVNINDKGWQPTPSEIQQLLPVRVGLEEPSWGESLLTVMMRSISAVGDVLKLFRPAFEGKRPDLVTTAHSRGGAGAHD